MGKKSLRDLIQMKNELEEKIYIQKWKMKYKLGNYSIVDLSKDRKLLEEIDNKLNKFINMKKNCFLERVIV